jgi:hypothetical protein
VSHRDSAEDPDRNLQEQVRTRGAPRHLAQAGILNAILGCAPQHAQCYRPLKMNKAEESNLHPDHVEREWSQLVDYWRAAKRVLLLTPAPDRDAVQWKQRQLNGDKGLKYCGIKPGELERAIAKDIAWLKVHPTRTKLLPKRGMS